MPRDLIFPTIEPSAPACCRGRPAQHLLGGVRQSGRRAGAVPAWRPGAGATPRTGASSIPRFYRIVIFDQRGAGRSRRSARSATTPRRPGRRHRALRRTSASSAGWSSAARGASTLALAYAEAHPERCRGLILRGIFLCREARSTGSSTACARLPRGVARLRRVPARGRARRSAGRLLPAADRPRPGGAHAGGARLEHLRRRVLDPAAEPGDRRRLRRGPHGARPRPASRRITSPTTSSCRRTACSRMSSASAASRHDRAGALRHGVPGRSPPTTCTGRGRKPSTWSCPMPATRRWSRASAAALVESDGAAEGGRIEAAVQLEPTRCLSRLGGRGRRREAAPGEGFLSRPGPTLHSDSRCAEPDLSRQAGEAIRF